MPINGTEIDNRHNILEINGTDINKRHNILERSMELKQTKDITFQRSMVMIDINKRHNIYLFSKLVSLSI